MNVTSRYGLVRGNPCAPYVWRAYLSGLQRIRESRASARNIPASGLVPSVVPMDLTSAMGFAQRDVMGSPRKTPHVWEAVMGASFSAGLRSAGKFSSSRVFRKIDSDAPRLARKLEPVNQPDESKRTALSDAWRASSW